MKCCTFLLVLELCLIAAYGQGQGQYGRPYIPQQTSQYYNPYETTQGYGNPNWGQNQQPPFQPNQGQGQYSQYSPPYDTTTKKNPYNSYGEGDRDYNNNNNYKPEPSHPDPDNEYDNNKGASSPSAGYGSNTYKDKKQSSYCAKEVVIGNPQGKCEENPAKFDGCQYRAVVFRHKKNNDLKQYERAYNPSCNDGYQRNFRPGDKEDLRVKLETRYVKPTGQNGYIAIGFMESLDDNFMHVIKCTSNPVSPGNPIITEYWYKMQGKTTAGKHLVAEEESHFCTNVADGRKNKEIDSSKFTCTFDLPISYAVNINNRPRSLNFNNTDYHIFVESEGEKFESGKPSWAGRMLTDNRFRLGLKVPKYTNNYKKGSYSSYKDDDDDHELEPCNNSNVVSAKVSTLFLFLILSKWVN